MKRFWQTGIAQPLWRPFGIRTLTPWALAVIVAMSSVGVAAAGKYNRVLDIGDPAPTWEPLPAAQGEPLGSADLSEAEVTVVVFTCNTCPYAVDAEPRLVELDAWVRERGGRLVAINVNQVEGDLMPAMKQRAESAGFTFPYLFDDSQAIAKAFGAMRTPECYVIDADWKVAYMGSIDDSPDGKDIQKHYVRDAVTATLAGQSVQEAETVPIGCGIRFERARGRSR